MTLTEIRDAVAEALNAVEGLTVRPRPTVKTPKQGDGWVTLGRMVPSDYSRSLVTLVVVVVLAADQLAAEELLETWAVDAIDAVTQADDLPVADVALEPVTLVVESGVSLHAFTLTLTTEVEA
jgi:hypothetical protein